MNILREKQRLLPMGSPQFGGGGGGQQQPTQTSVANTNIPEYARPYVETMLGSAQQQIYNYEPDESGNLVATGFKGYTPFSTNPNDYFAEFSPMQQASFQGAANLYNQGPASQIGLGSQLAGAAGFGALGTQYQGGQFGARDVRAPYLQQYQMQGPGDVSTQSFTQPGAAADYMNPYMQNVVDIQKREAQRASDIAATQQAAQATRAGAFGGSRAGIVEAERQRNLAQQLGDIQATGSQAAYNAAQQQFNAEQARALQAAQANQQMGYNVGAQNLAAQLGVQQLGAGQNLQAQQLNQAARLQAQQLAEQSRQYGAGLGLQGLQTGLQAAGQLGNLGQTQYGQQTGTLNLLNQLGAQQQAQEQAKINQQIQDYATQQQYPMLQLASMSNLLRGLPMQSTTTQTYQAAPSAVSQLAGLGTAAAGAYKMFGSKKGGKVPEPKKKKDDGAAGLMGLALSKI